jgi:DNA-binding transcriptional LysR family regulator
MLLRNLRYLEALAREQHFARAAKACQVTQPTLSAGIKQLEEELGLLIVQRGQRFHGLTPEGLHVVEWSRRILADVESLEQEASELRAGLVGRLRIGAIPVALPMVALLTAPFAARHPQVAITVTSLSSIEIQRGLDDFTLDAGVTYLDNEPLSHVRTLPLYRERFHLFTPAGGPAGAGNDAGWADTAGLPLCLLTPDMQNRRILNGLFAAHGVTPHATIETNSVLTLWAHLRTGRWSSILPHPFLYLLGVPEGLRALPLDRGEGHFTIGLVVPDREPMTPSARELLRVAGELDVAAELDRKAGPAGKREAGRHAGGRSAPPAD